MNVRLFVPLFQFLVTYDDDDDDVASTESGAAWRGVWFVPATNDPANGVRVPCHILQTEGEGGRELGNAGTQSSAYFPHHAHLVRRYCQTLSYN